MRASVTLAAAMICLMGLASTEAFAQTPPGLGDLVGMRGGSLDGEMENRGYDLARTQGAQYWWNSDSRVCAAISISNGRVAKIRSATARECGKSGAAANSRPFDCNAPDLSEADRYRCPQGGGSAAAAGGAGRDSAIRACTDAFGPNGRLGAVSALRQGFWEVILSDSYGRKVSCTGRSDGRVEQWDELGKR
jgi:hypothetical protein